MQTPVRSDHRRGRNHGQGGGHIPAQGRRYAVSMGMAGWGEVHCTPSAEVPDSATRARGCCLASRACTCQCMTWAKRTSPPSAVSVCTTWATLTLHTLAHCLFCSETRASHRSQRHYTLTAPPRLVCVPSCHRQSHLSRAVCAQANSRVSRLAGPCGRCWRQERVSRHSGNGRPTLHFARLGAGVPLQRVYTHGLRQVLRGLGTGMQLLQQGVHTGEEGGVVGCGI